MKPVKSKTPRYPQLITFQSERRELLTLLAKGAAILGISSTLGCIVEPGEADAGSISEADIFTAGDVHLPPDAGEPPAPGGEPEPQHPDAGAPQPPDAGAPQPPDAGEPPIAGGAPQYPDAEIFHRQVRVPEQGSAYFMNQTEDGAFFELQYHLLIDTRSETLSDSLREEEADWYRRFNAAFEEQSFSCPDSGALPNPQEMNEVVTHLIVQYAREQYDEELEPRVQLFYDGCQPEMLAGEAPGW